MSKLYVWFVFALLLAAGNAFAQTDLTPEELAQETARLAAEQAYFDQVLATARSREAAANAEQSAQQATLTQSNQLVAAQLAAEFAVSNAVKTSGLSTAAGKEGTVALTSTENTPLSFRSGSLDLASNMSAALCSKVKAAVVGATGTVFVAPTDYDKVVAESTHDVLRVSTLHSSAKQGTAEIANITKQSVAGVAGALVTAQYLAGGIQSLSKLFRTDYTLTYTATDRSAIFKDYLEVVCKSTVVGNVEGRLQLGAAEVLSEWISEMAVFIDSYESLDAVSTSERARITIKKVEVKGDNSLDAATKRQLLDALDISSRALESQEHVVQKYKSLAASLKAFLSSDKTAVFTSFTWGQGYLAKIGGAPDGIPAVDLSGMHRLSYQLEVEDSVLKSSSAFLADRIRPLSTVELTYSLRNPNGLMVAAGFWSKTKAGDTVKIKKLSFADKEGEAEAERL